jgi:ABC-type lipoprotein release transport system permease subunit
VLRWFQEKLTEKLEGDEIQEVADKPVRVRIAEEGEAICGSSVHVSRRKILSDLYQFIKVKVPTELLKDPHNNTVAAIAEIAKDFQQEFPDEQSLREYLEENTTEEDRVRLEGKIFKEAMIVSDGDQIESQSDTTALESNHIALTKNLALALGVLEGNQLTVTTDDDPRERQFVVTIVKKINGKIPRQPVFSDKSEIKNGQNVVIAK